MNMVQQFLQTTFSPLVLLFTVSNLAAMGLQVKMPEVMEALRNKKSLVLIFVWGWVLGPAFGYLITRISLKAMLCQVCQDYPIQPYFNALYSKCQGFFISVPLAFADAPSMLLRYPSG